MQLSYIYTIYIPPSYIYYPFDNNRAADNGTWLSYLLVYVHVYYTHTHPYRRRKCRERERRANEREERVHIYRGSRAHVGGRMHASARTSNIRFRLRDAERPPPPRTISFISLSLSLRSFVRSHRLPIYTCAGVLYGCRLSLSLFLSSRLIKRFILRATLERKFIACTGSVAH